MNQFIQIISQDGYNLYIPIPIAKQAEYLRKIIMSNNKLNNTNNDFNRNGRRCFLNQN